MKRLTKKSEFYNGYKPDDENYFEIFKNPTSKEWSDVKKNNNEKSDVI